MPAPHLVLASGSPRRRELLSRAGYQFEVVVPSPAAEIVEDSAIRDPAELVAYLAARKADDVARQLASRGGRRARTLIAADTVAECRGQILGKPRDEDDARAMLGALRGETHRVLSGLCVWPWPAGGNDQPLTRVDETLLCMDRLSDDQLETYLASGQWRGKAGAFGYQDRLGWVHVVAGSESNVVGLPLELLAKMLADLGH